jgi:hypothetical protein
MRQPTASVPKGGADGSRSSHGVPGAARAWRACALAWVLPGGGHGLLGQPRKAVVLLVVLLAMFGLGLGFGGRLFPFQVSEPLVFLAAAAEWALLLPRLLAGAGGLGQGDVVAPTYEYGNTFLIVGGLLNLLVILDVFDRALGRRRP